VGKHPAVNTLGKQLIAEVMSDVGGVAAPATAQDDETPGRVGIRSHGERSRTGR
jgi:hypothetical protein